MVRKTDAATPNRRNATRTDRPLSAAPAVRLRDDLYERRGPESASHPSYPTLLHALSPRHYPGIYVGPPFPRWNHSFYELSLFIQPTVKCYIYCTREYYPKEGGRSSWRNTHGSD